MDIVKQCIDVAVVTNNLGEMLQFWQKDAGLRFEETLPVAESMNQYRHAIQDSVFKLNHTSEDLPSSSHSGYRELIIARSNIYDTKEMIDPDGNILKIVPKDHMGITGIGIHLAVRDENEFDHFYGNILNLPKVGHRMYRCGSSIISFEKDHTAKKAGDIYGKGYRYITIHVRKADMEHQEILKRGGLCLPWNPGIQYLRSGQYLYHCQSRRD